MPFLRPLKTLSSVLEARKDRIGVWKDFSASAQSIATILALVVGGIWTYTLFGVQRQTHPRLKLEHRISHRPLPNGDTLLSVSELLSNTGSVLLGLRDGEIRIIQVVPMPLTGAKSERRDALPDVARRPEVWPVLRMAEQHWKEGEKVLEPGEDDQIHCAFVLPPMVTTVAVVSYVRNPSNANLGWQHLTMYDIPQTMRAPAIRGKRRP